MKLVRVKREGETRESEERVKLLRVKRESETRESEERQ